MLRAVLLLLTIPLLCGWSTSGTTTTKSRTQYYLANAGSGGNDANTGTSRGDPWATVAKFLTATTVPGDEVYFERGDTWAEQLAVDESGAAGVPITFAAYGTGAKPILNIEKPITATSIDHIIIRDVDLVGWLNHGLHITDCDGWTIVGNDISGGTEVNPVMFGIYIQGTSSISGVTIDSNDIGPIGTYAAGTDMAATPYFGVRTFDVEDAVIIGNDIHGINGFAIHHQGPVGHNLDAIIAGNTIRDGFIGGIQIWAQDDSTISRNIIRDGAGFAIGNYESDGTTIEYNLIHDVVIGSNNNLFNGIDVTGDSQDGFIYNNTIYAVENNNITLEDWVTGSDGWTVKNNIMDATANTQFHMVDGRRAGLAVFTGVSSWTDTNNLFNAFVGGPLVDAIVNRGGGAGGTLHTLVTWQALTYGANSYDDDPLFTNPGANNFTLQFGSPAINKGDSLGYTTDIAGNPIVGIPDMGAYEYQP